ncbi:hypothetical protein U9M48_030268 [Paspalum notatum var. saurae]|uniref:Retrotransposon gag domain-containing protein n=1 Tax=Paspalum notatum var. saurae TaxID=547442 RepID=A0AAQ3U0G5_PASNO
MSNTDTATISKALTDLAQQTGDRFKEITKAVSDVAVQLSDLANQFAALEPLVPIAKSLEALPGKVNTLQGAVRDGTKQVAALNLAVARVEKLQRRHTGDKSGSEVDSSDEEDSKTKQPPLKRPPPASSSGKDKEEDFFHPHAKLEFPVYDGTGDPLPWLNRCEAFFRVQHTPDAQRVRYASLHMSDAAQLWFTKLEHNSGTPSCKRFVKLINRRFDPPMTDSPLGELALLHRTGTVVEYTVRAAASTALSGGQVELLAKLNVSLRKPKSLDETIMLARAYEQRLLLPATESVSSRHTVPRIPQITAAAAPPEGDRFASMPRRHLSPAEMQQQRQAGLRYNCDEKFVPGHRCKRIFVLEVVPDDEDPTITALELQEDPMISIHALTGICARGQQVMQLWVFIAGVKLVALIDSGSTCCFVDSAVANKLGLALHQQAGLHVTVGNGDQIKSLGLFPGLFISMGSDKFVADFYALPLGTYDVVLGVNWLSSLGPILWDFNHHTMAFQRANCRITWIGIDAPRPVELWATTLHDGELMTALLDEFTGVFQEPQGLPPQRAISSAPTPTLWQYDPTATLMFRRRN